MTVKTLANRWNACTDCRLHRGAKTHVLWELSPRFNRPITFIGIAPGATENLRGTPLCGYSGRAFRVMLDALRIRNYCLTNLVACIPRPLGSPTYRDPTTGEIDACRLRLIDLFKLIQPSAIITLGKLAEREGTYVQDVPRLHVSHPRIWQPPEFTNLNYRNACDAIKDFITSHKIRRNAS